MRIIIAVILMGFISTLVWAEPNTESPSIGSEQGYAETIATLEKFVARYAKQRVNTVYIAKTKQDGSEDAQEYLYAYWKEDKSILLLEHFRGSGGDTDFLWLHRKARIDLRTGVVPTQLDIHGSTYLADRPWANRIIEACTTQGRKLVILKPRRSK